MITDGKKWHYLAVKSLSSLFRGITLNHNGDFYCFHSYTTKNKLEKYESVCNDHDYCYVEIMPNEDNKTLKYNHIEKSMKAPFVIYADLEYLPEKMHSKNTPMSKNPEKFHTEKNYAYTFWLPIAYKLFI